MGFRKCALFLPRCILGWRAAAFLIGLVFSSSLSNYAAKWEFESLLTDIWKMKLPYATATLSIQAGIKAFMAIFFNFLADAKLGKYLVIMLSTVLYIMGWALLTTSTILMKTKVPLLLYTSLFLIAMGQGGHMSSLKAFGKSQFETPKEDEKIVGKARTIIWWQGGILLGIVAVVFLTRSTDEKAIWGINGWTSTAVMSASILVFICGAPFYIYYKLPGSPLVHLFRVFVAATLKANLDCPADAHQLYEKHGLKDEDLLAHTNGLRWLDKAAIPILENRKEEVKKWRLCTVTEVEETKLLLRMFPIWATCLVCGAVKAMEDSCFLAQSNSLDSGMYVTNVVLMSSLAASWAISRLCKRVPPLIKLGVGLCLSILCCSCASVVEERRLKVVREHQLLDSDDSVPMNAIWLAPQFLLLGSMDALLDDGMDEFFNTQVPQSMRSLGPSFSQSVTGCGSILVAIFILSSKRSGSPSWLDDTINSSRLDHFYRAFTIFGYCSLFFYIFISRRYAYNILATTGGPRPEKHEPAEFHTTIQMEHLQYDHEDGEAGARKT